MARVEILVNCRNELGEGPLWDPERQTLFWLDCLETKIHACRADGSEHQDWTVPDVIGSMALRSGGGAVMALRDGFYAFDFASGETQLLARPEDRHPHARMNDGKVDRQGRFVAGGMDTEEKNFICKLYSLDREHKPSEIMDGICVSNGPCWSPDGTVFYFADSLRKEIWAFDYDTATGGVSNRRSWASLKDEPGYADGSTVDAEGCLWNAQVFAGQVVRYTPDGRVDRRIDLPVKNVTSVMFGGEGLDTLYVTAMARENPHAPADKANAGALFAIHDLGVKGLPEPYYAG